MGRKNVSRKTPPPPQSTPNSFRKMGSEKLNLTNGMGRGKVDGMINGVIREREKGMSNSLVKMSGKVLIPTAGNVEDMVDMLVQMVSQKGVRVSKMMNEDSLAFNESDMRWFGKEWFGKIPSWNQFLRALRKVSPEAEKELRYAEAEALGEKYESTMAEIVEKEDEELTPLDGKRFSWGEKLYKIQERKLARLDSKDKGSTEQGVDLAIKVIQSLSDAQLMRAKKVMDAEWEAVDNGNK